MTLVTQEEHESKTAELVRSVHNSIRDLRNVIEGLNQQFIAGEDVELALVAKVLSPAEGLIRNCQRLETILAEQTNRTLGIVQGGYAVNLDHARFEIGCRLARLRTCCSSGAVSA